MHACMFHAPRHALLYIIVYLTGYLRASLLLYIDSRKDLNKILKGLSELEITREDLLDNREAAGRTESSELGAPLPDTTILLMHLHKKLCRRRSRRSG